MRITNVLFGLMLCMSCGSKTVETPNGFIIEVLKNGDGLRPSPGQHVIFDFVFHDSKDSVFGNTFLDNNPTYYIVKDSIFLTKETGLEQTFRMVSRGDSIKFKATAEEIFVNTWKTSLPKGVEATEIFTFYFRVSDILNKPQFLEWQADLMFREEQKSQEQMKIQLSKDKGILARYIDSLGVKDIIETESGILYRITKRGTGLPGKSMQTAYVNYSVYLLNGICFDTNVQQVAKEKGVILSRENPYQPVRFMIDNSEMILGWHEMLKILNKGSKATVYVPSTLAYGNNKMNKYIKENTILIFDLEIVDIK